MQDLEKVLHRTPTEDEARQLEEWRADATVSILQGLLAGWSSGGLLDKPYAQDSLVDTAVQIGEQLQKRLARAIVHGEG